jgi:hypothetical protein
MMVMTSVVMHAPVLLWIVLIVFALSAADRAYMDGQNAAFMVSGMRSLAVAFNRQVDDLLQYLRK